MPILAPETDIYPEGLLDVSTAGSEDAASWWVLYTKPRHEKELMRRLRAWAISFYGPLLTRRSRSRAGRVHSSQVPLFPGYVFLHGAENDRYRALTSNCVCRWLTVADGAGLTRDLRQVRQLLESGAAVTPEARLEPGTPVRIRSGPLMGLEGVVIKRFDQARLLISVNFLQQGASILLDDYQIEGLG